MSRIEKKATENSQILSWLKRKLLMRVPYIRSSSPSHMRFSLRDFTCMISSIDLIARLLRYSSSLICCVLTFFSLSISIYLLICLQLQVLQALFSRFSFSMWLIHSPRQYSCFLSAIRRTSSGSRIAVPPLSCNIPDLRKVLMKLLSFLKTWLGEVLDF